jgi:hypothetical protein
MFPKHSADLAIVVGDHHAAKDDDAAPDSEPEMDPEEHSSKMDDAADEIFDAMKKGDRNAFREALEAFCDLHATKPPEDEVNDNEGGEDDEAEAENEDDGHNGIHY